MQTKENQSAPSMNDFPFYKSLLHPDKASVKGILISEHNISGK